MNHLSRRRFVKGGLLAAAATGLGGCASRGSVNGHTSVRPLAKVRGANEEIRVGIIGVRGKGNDHIRMFRAVPGVRIVAICDADRKILATRAKEMTEFDGAEVDTYLDMRYLFDRDDIDAVSTATPNHWHALASIWACQSGKDMYVEKPVCHNIYEGRKLVEAARRYDRIVQAGTQNRSSTGLMEAAQFIRDGNLGRIVRGRAFCYKRRESIGKVDAPQPVPDHIDYDLWAGPAPLDPITRRQFHYDWHWVWATGNGDIGNQGIHEMDMARWLLGEDKLAPRVMSIGGRFGYDDDGETPNTQIAILDYDTAPLIFEVRGLPRQTDDSAMDHYRGVRIGVCIECENGYFAGSHGGGWAFDNNDNRIRQFKAQGPENHVANFIQAVRSRKQSDLNADVLEGHISSSLCHQANISHRLGAAASQGEILEAIRGDAGAIDSYERFREHLSANDIYLEQTPATLGPWLAFDVNRERFQRGYLSEQANALVTREYRKPFVVPDRV